MIVRNANVDLHNEVAKSREDRRKEYDDAMKANEKEAKEIQKGHGEKAKKISNKSLKAMHLSESLFDNIEESLAPEDNPNIQNGYVTKPYWYFTKHGVQPGSVPKVPIEEVVDDADGTYFSTYNLLTTKELNDYDIEERTPSDGLFEDLIPMSDYVERLSDEDRDALVDELAHAINRVLENSYWTLSYDELKEVCDTACEFVALHAEGAQWTLAESYKLNEKKWDMTLDNSSELRTAINNEDYQEVIKQIQIAYKQMLDSGVIDEDDYYSWTEDFELYGDFSDWDDPEDTVNYELNNFYDACDNLNIWVSI